MKKALAVCAIPFGCGLISTVLFFWQGGFGGGHGRFDQIIFFLELPSVPLLEHVPLPRFFQKSDLLQIIWVPSIINILFFSAATALVMTIKVGISRSS